MIKKRYLRKQPICKVTFYTEPGLEAESVAVVGDFNGWADSTTPMKQMKNGKFSASVNLTLNGTYQFQYLVDGSQYVNDSDPDAFAPNPHGGQNSVVFT